MCYDVGDVGLELVLGDGDVAGALDPLGVVDAGDGFGLLAVLPVSLPAVIEKNRNQLKSIHSSQKPKRNYTVDVFR